MLKGPLDNWEETKRTSRLTSDLSVECGVDIARIFTTPETYANHSASFFDNVRREGRDRVPEEQSALLRKAAESIEAAQLAPHRNPIDGARLAPQAVRNLGPDRLLRLEPAERIERGAHDMGRGQASALVHRGRRVLIDESVR